MPTTPAGIRYPASSDAINIPQDLLNLATDVDTYITASAITAAGTFTLTNKTIDAASNTLTGVATLTGTQTLTNKTLASPTFTGQVTGLELAFSQSIVFEGTTADSFELTLSAGEPTADHTVTFQDATGTIALVSQVTDLEIAVIMAAF